MFSDATRNVFQNDLFKSVSVPGLSLGEIHVYLECLKKIVMNQRTGKLQNFTPFISLILIYPSAKRYYVFSTKLSLRI